MKYFDPDNGGVWQEVNPGTRPAPDLDACSTSSISVVGDHRGLYRTKSTSSRYSLKSNGTDGGQGSGIMKISRTFSRHRKRVVLKNGTVNLSKEHVSKRSQRYLQDIFTTLVDIQWRYNLMVFAMGFILSWLVFSLIWWLICLAHGDFDHVDDEEWTPCVTNVDSFATAFLFSVETQHTIGYGSRYTNAECPEALFIMCAQSITGVMIQCFMAGIVFAKLSRPKKRSQTLMFSRYACVCLRDGKLCFMFRVGDMRKSHIIGAKISAQVIRRKTTAEGEVIPYYHTLLDVRFDDGGDDVFLIWPATIVHIIHEGSPFFIKSAEDMLRERFEVVVILEGTIESTGQSIQARSSYIASEILWGHRFDQAVTYNKEKEEYLVNYSKFHATHQIRTPLCSSRDLLEIIGDGKVVSFRKETGEYLVDYSKFNATHEVQTPLCSSRDFLEYQRMLADIAMKPLAPDHGSTTASTGDYSYRRSNSSPEEDGARASSKLIDTMEPAPLAVSEC